MLPLMRNLPTAKIPDDRRLILGSSSPRRAELLTAAGYAFTVEPASDAAECGICTSVTAPELVARYAFRKAIDVGRRYVGTPEGRQVMILAADTVASKNGMILGKPKDRDHAHWMLTQLADTIHDVYTGVCLMTPETSRSVVEVVRTRLEMQPLSDAQLKEYLDTELWIGKAGSFGYQDGNDWLELVDPNSSQSNVVGLPMERLAELLEQFDHSAIELKSEDLTDENR